MANRLGREPRTKLVPVAVNEQERKLFQALARKRHTSLAEVIRQVLYREIELEKQKQNAA